MNQAEKDKLLRDGASHLIKRATNGRALDAHALLPRLVASFDKYFGSGRREATPQSVIQFLDALHPDDLCLVLACERGDETAWRDLVKQYETTVRSAARSATSSDDQAEELAQSVWAELYGLRTRNHGDHRPAGKLAYYSGCGSLGGWLRAVVGQLAIDSHRRSARLVQPEEAADFDRLASESSQKGLSPSGPLNPEQMLAKGEAARHIHAALSCAIAKLEAEDRLLIKLYYFDNLRLREAAQVLGVHEATASRRLSRLHAEVRRSVESLLIADRGWTREDASAELSEAAETLNQIDLRRAFTSTEQSER